LKARCCQKRKEVILAKVSPWKYLTTWIQKSLHDHRPHKSATQLSFKQTMKFIRAYDYISLQKCNNPQPVLAKAGE
jgi:hypothetical protein